MQTIAPARLGRSFFSLSRSARSSSILLSIRSSNASAEAVDIPELRDLSALVLNPEPHALASDELDVRRLAQHPV
jgi:hypothetical protein